jgi:hypothetical protein
MLNPAVTDTAAVQQGRLHCHLQHEALSAFAEAAIVIGAWFRQLLSFN